jgi:hypothetical protein
MQSFTFMLGNHVDRQQVDTAAVMGAYPPLPEPLVVIIRAAMSVKIQRFMTYGRLYCCDTLLGWPLQPRPRIGIRTQGARRPKYLYTKRE